MIQRCRCQTKLTVHCLNDTQPFYVDFLYDVGAEVKLLVQLKCSTRVKRVID